MTTWVLRDGELVEKHLAPPRHSRDAAHYVISDNIGDTWHPATGQTYDSKSAFRRATKAAGCVEIGTEKQIDRRDMAARDVRRDVEAAIRKVNEGYRPQTERDSYSGDGWQ